MSDPQIKDYALEVACQHYLCEHDTLTFAEQFTALYAAAEEGKCDLPDGICTCETYDDYSACDLADNIDGLRCAFETAMRAARDGGDPDYLANSDQFKCTACKQVFDNDDSIQLKGDLYCTNCAASVFGRSTITTPKIPCPVCGVPVTLPADWQGSEEEAICNQCHNADIIPCVRVEYDLSFFGGNYDKVGKFAFIAVDKINDCTVEEAFEKQTGINRQHIIHFSTDDLYSPQGEDFDSIEVRIKALRQMGSIAPTNILEKPCPHCKTNLCAPGAVERHYIDKDAPETMGDFSDAIGFGHYDHEGNFEPDHPADLSGGRYDLMDDSDRCASCGGQL
ncbi:hypothetical protein FY034_17445 (plasmid) [Trichlorobacter lovleyi]|uniref:hypothetical protein n=1 Tax=Trichlorobacter lovleyi TaxID=313985 RepID=UPI00223F1D7C|nr:hypothetical protein [Trichlorobacter lovleyi]QOX80808.1 hypothetical protein FY034_17445 [Trichlorobacter lovleyi]